MDSKKIIVIAVSAVLVLALAGVGIYGAVTSADKPADETTTAIAQGADVTVTETEQDGSTGTTTPVSTTDPGAALAEAILGKWTDSANMSGYHFYEDGTVEMTYVNLTVPIINVPINGTSKGMYTLEGDKLTTKFSIYSATIENTYTVKVENNMLSMRDHEDGETATYARATADATSSAVSGTTTAVTSPSGSADDSELVGSWVNSDSTEKYVFNTDGTVAITLDDKTYNGVYMIIDDTLTVQYSVKSKKVTDKYTFTTSKNTLSLEKDGDTTLLIRSGTTFAPSSNNSLLGIWRDGANMSGYEFLEGGVAKVTFVNFTIPVLNMPINGTFTGSYSVSGDKLTVNYSIYGNSINDSFTFSVKDNVLTLVDGEGETSTYLKQ